MLHSSSLSFSVIIAIIIIIVVAVPHLSHAQTCNTLFSFESGTASWGAGQPPDYSTSASTSVATSTTYASDGTNSLQMNWDFSSGEDKAVYYVQGLSYDWSAKTSVVFDIWKSGFSAQVTLAVKTGAGATWFESQAYNLQDGKNTITVDLKSSTWKSQASGWANNAALSNSNSISFLAISVVLPSSTPAGANKAYLDNVRICAPNTPTTTPTSSPVTIPPVSAGDFVKARGTTFTTSSGCDFYFAGTNNYYLIYKSNYMVDAVLDDAVAMGLKVIRTWGFIDFTPGGNNIDSDKGVYFQYFPSGASSPSYNDGDNGLKKLDYVLNAAKTRGIRILISLVNNWKEFGGMDQYVTWANLNYHSDFYTSDTIKTWYKNYVLHLLNRVNTYSNVAYKNDPTVFAWELTNELRCIGSGNKGSSSSCTSQTLVSWASEMSTFVKQNDPNHMVSVGDEGFFENPAILQGSNAGWIYSGTGDFDKMVALPNIDFGTVHVYPSHWSQSDSWANTFITQHVTSANAVNKPVLIEEFGWPNGGTRASIYSSWLTTMENSNVAGDTYWMLASKEDSGSLYPDYDTFTVYNDASSEATLIKQHAAKMSTKGTCAPAPSTTGPSTGAQSTGAQSTGAQSTGAQSTGAQSTGAQSTGAQSTGAQSTGVQSTGDQSTGAQSTVKIMLLVVIVVLLLVVF